MHSMKKVVAYGQLEQNKNNDTTTTTYFNDSKPTIHKNYYLSFCNININ